MRSREFLVVALLLCISGPGAAEESKPLRLGSDVWPPFTDVAGKPRVALDLVHQALQRIGVEAETTVEARFEGLVGKIRDQELDGSAALWKTPEREADILFSKPYLENRLVLVGRKGGDLSAKTLGELAGKRIAIVGSYGYGPEVKEARGPVFVEGASDSANLRKLVSGEVDYVLADELLVFYLFQNYEEKAKRLLQAGRAPIMTRSLHLGLRRSLAGAQDVLDRFEAEIRAMVADGSYNRALQLDWIMVDIDGDGITEMVHDGTDAGEMPPGASYQVFEMGEPDEPRVELRYLINGQSYDDWDKVPPEYKVPMKHGIDPGRPGIVLFEF